MKTLTIFRCCKTIVIPDGNYTETDLIDTLNYMITKPLDVLEVDSNVFFNDKNEIVDEHGNLCNSDDYIINDNNEILLKDLNLLTLNMLYLRSTLTKMALGVEELLLDLK